MCMCVCVCMFVCFAFAEAMYDSLHTGAELSEFVGARDSLAKFVCFRLDASSEDTYLCALLQFLKVRVT